MLPKTFLTGGNFSWIVATAGSWSCKLSRGAAGFSFSRLADRGLWQSSSLFSKAQLKAVGPALAGPTLVRLQHLYQPVTRILAGTEIKTISERRFGKQQRWKALLFSPCGGNLTRNPAQDCTQLRLWGGNSTPRGEAIGALLPLNVSGRFVYIPMHFGRGIAETELVIAAFAPDWLGHLSSSLAAKQHPPLLTLIHTAHKSPGSSSGTGFGTSVTDWAKSAHDKKKLRKPAMKAVIFVRHCYRFSSLKTTVNKIQQNFL